MPWSLTRQNFFRVGGQGWGSGLGVRVGGQGRGSGSGVRVGLQGWGWGQFAGFRIVFKGHGF